MGVLCCSCKVKDDNYSVLFLTLLLSNSVPIFFTGGATDSMHFMARRYDVALWRLFSLFQRSDKHCLHRMVVSLTSGCCFNFRIKITSFPLIGLKLCVFSHNLIDFREFGAFKKAFWSRPAAFFSLII